MDVAGRTRSDSRSTPSRLGDHQGFRAAARRAAVDGRRHRGRRIGVRDLANDLNVRLDNVQVQDINELMLGQPRAHGQC